MSEVTATPAVENRASKQERLDFLKQVIAFTEANIRSYDIKAQISLAAFVLSGNPLVGIVNSVCGQGPARNVLVIMLVFYIATILTYLFVLWPVSATHGQLTKGLAANNLFYLHDPLSVGGTEYSARLNGLVVEPELTAESLKLSHIRKVKARRFKAALIVTLITYLVIAGSFFGIGRCGW
jgi:hypothetical protein